MYEMKISVGFSDIKILVWNFDDMKNENDIGG